MATTGQRISPLGALLGSLWLAVLTACGGSAANATDGSTSMTDKSELLREAGSMLGKFYAGLKQLRQGPTSPGMLSGDELRSADDCEAGMELWRKKGVAGSDPIFSYDFNDHPKAKSNTIPMSEMRAICDEYRPLYERYRAAFDLLQAEGMLARMREYLKPDDPAVNPGMVNEYELRSNPARVANALAAARRLDPAMKVGKRRLALDAYESEIATPLAAVAPRWIADARAAFRGRNERIAGKYAAAGITGQKLDLMVSYDGVYWRLAGGARTDDPRSLAKASVLFQWLSQRDPDDDRFELHTVRRYTFAADRIADVTDHRYRRLAGVELGAEVFR